MTPAATSSLIRRIGVHTSVAGGLPLAAERAQALGCQTLQIFSSSPRQWRGAELDPAACARMIRLRREYGLRPLVVHANYLINAAGADPALWERSIAALRGELLRARQLQAEFLVLHPGAPGAGNDRAAAIARVGEAVRRAAQGLRWGRLKLLLENTAGGGRLGGAWEEMAALLAAVSAVPSGVCIDTCHAWAAGYDIRSAAGYHQAIAALHRAVGLKHVHVIHVNDSKGGCNSHVDRHQNIGQGTLGREAFRLWMNDPRWARKAFLLETPVDAPGDDRKNLNRLRSLIAAPAPRANARPAPR